ncbi:MAG: response regulator [Bacteroidales bacterium]|nr:response regulator [Bacteroidales bacterium]
MRIVIIEDEAYAARRLVNLISAYNPEFKIVACLESVHNSINWFTKNKQPDLVFLDIHLEDDLSLAIFKKVTVTCPIIFTTATDQLAIKVFFTKGIDFLHKPIVQVELNQLLDKITKMRSYLNQTIDASFFEDLINQK